MQDEILIVGAGPAGLAVGACLARAGLKATLLERADAVGSSWRHHYERLHLHTARQNSTLPGMDFPAGTQRWPSRQEVVDYLTAYASHHRLDIRFNVAVRRIVRDDAAWTLSTDGAELHATRVVLATGYPRVASLPDWPGRDRFRGEVMHSSDYRNGEAFRDGPMRQIKEHGRIPLIDIGTLALIRDGRVALRGDVCELDEEGVVFADGKREPFDAIIAATGYAPRLDELAPDLPLDEQGSPRSSGCEIAPGLFACGFYVAPTGMLREIGIEAQRIVDAITSALS